MNLFSLLFTTTFCCTKNRIKMMIYKYNGTRISDEFACRLCICSFILNLISIDIVLRMHFIPFILYLFFSSHLSATSILFISSSMNIYLIISLYGEIRCLVKTINCKCVAIDANDNSANDNSTDDIYHHYGHMHGHVD